MRKRGKTQKTSTVLWNLSIKIWAGITATLAGIAAIIAFLSDSNGAIDFIRKIDPFIISQRPENCFKEYSKDSLFIFIPNFQLRSADKKQYYSQSLANSIITFSSLKNLKIKVCNLNVDASKYTEDITSLQLNSDLTIWLDVLNPEMNKDFLIHSTVSDTLNKIIKLQDSEYDVKVSNSKIASKNILTREFQVNGKSFESWLIEIYNFKIGFSNPQNIYLDKPLEGRELADYYSNKGRLYFLNSRFGEALDCFNKSIAIYPSNEENYYDLGLSYLENGNFELAKYHFNKLAQKKDLVLLSHSLIGFTNFYMGNYEDAIKSYSEAIKYNNQLPELFTNRAICKYFLKKYEEANLDFSRALNFDSCNAAINNNIGLIKLHQKKLIEANRYFYKAVEIQPFEALSHYNKGLSQISNKQYLDGMNEIYIAKTLDPNLSKLDFTNRRRFEPPITSDTYQNLDSLFAKGELNFLIKSMMKIDKNSMVKVPLIGSGANNNFYLCDNRLLANKILFYYQLLGTRVSIDGRAGKYYLNDYSTGDTLSKVVWHTTIAFQKKMKASVSGEGWFGATYYPSRYLGKIMLTRGHREEAEDIFKKADNATKPYDYNQEVLYRFLFFIFIFIVLTFRELILGKFQVTGDDAFLWLFKLSRNSIKSILTYFFD